MQDARGFAMAIGTDTDAALAPDSSTEMRSAANSSIHRYAFVTLMVVGCVATAAAGGIHVFSRSARAQFDSHFGESITDLQTQQAESNAITSLARDFHKGDTTMYVSDSSIFKEGQSFYIIAGDQAPVATVLSVIDGQRIELDPTSDMINFDIPQYSSVVRPAMDISEPSPTHAPTPPPTAPPTPSPTSAPAIEEEEAAEETEPPTPAPTPIVLADVAHLDDGVDDGEHTEDQNDEPGEGFNFLWISLLLSILACCACAALLCFFVRKPSTTKKEAVPVPDEPADVDVGENKGVVRTTYIALAGDDTLEVTSTEGFQRKDMIEISSDGGKEQKVIKEIPPGQSSIVVEEALEYSHPPHAAIYHTGRPAISHSREPTRSLALGDLSSGAWDKTTPAFKTPRRSKMIQDLFAVLDKDKDGLLSDRELFVLAKVDGFSGSEKEWAQVFSQFTRTHFDNSQGGCSAAQFTNLVNDRNPEMGMYLTDDEMERYLDELDTQQLEHGYLSRRGV